jgi:hypothetical protein
MERACMVSLFFLFVAAPAERKVRLGPYAPAISLIFSPMLYVYDVWRKLGVFRVTILLMGVC